MTGEPTSEHEIQREREFQNKIDLSPLENVLIGSSVALEDGRLLGSDLLASDENLAKNSDFLLKPYGLTTNKSDIQEVTRNREERGRLTGWLTCFKPLSGIAGKYELGLNLGSLDENYLTPGEFRIDFRKLIDDNWIDLERLEGEDLEAFNRIALREDQYSQLFSLDKQKDSSTFVLKYKGSSDETQT